MAQPLSPALEQQIIEVEEQLRLAMLTSDIAALDQLLADDLTFTSHLGQIISKQDDLAFHQSGLCRFQAIEYSERRIQPLREGVVVFVQVQWAGLYGETAFHDNLRFTRLWQRSPQGLWQVIIGHSSAINSNVPSSSVPKD
ncbi:nuclear transport factor 2 family protein [Acaryochloris sp. IP29b_bin.137]|uniref:nuclear transport factor 2 family protein n=1 Tax=Acaryochloris sp. IP29b_bin.137 TaxID=2969217 RepID=UPI0026304347|nr:nuclear transport factor 2 family protein [Acaryochloris sp. IP29b_bin.137]